MFRTLVDIGKIILSFVKDTSLYIVQGGFLTTSFNDIASQFGVPAVPSEIPLIGVLADSSILSVIFSTLMLQILVISLLKRVIDIFT